MSTNSKKYNKLYYQKHKEERKKSRDKWRRKNPEYRKKSYQDNRGKELKQMKQWAKNNPEKVKNINERFYQKHLKLKLQYVQNYKISKGCQLCGYNENPEFLGFHHPDDNKEFNVSKATTHNSSLKMIKEEMDKCILLCNVCHPKLHWKLRMEKEKSLT